MRMILKVSMPTDVMNELIREGKLTSTMEKLLGAVKPEATYFTLVDGERTIFLVVDVAQPQDMFRLAEPFFLALEASLDCYPVMLPEDLAKAAAEYGPSLEQFNM